MTVDPVRVGGASTPPDDKTLVSEPDTERRDSREGQTAPFTRSVRWCVVFRNGGEWRLYSVRGTHDGASLELSEAHQKHPAWEFRIATKTEEWAFDD